MIMRILAISLNCTWNGPMVTQRATPPTPSPMTRLIARRARLTKYSGHANVRNQL
jgi:hypothetical protein